MYSMSNRDTMDASIAKDASTSSAVNLGAFSVLGIVLPTGAASLEATTTQIRFYVSVDGSTYGTLYDKDGTVVAVTVAAANTVGFAYLPPDAFAAWNFVKVITTTADGTAVVQATAARTIKLRVGHVVG